MVRPLIKWYETHSFQCTAVIIAGLKELWEADADFPMSHQECYAVQNVVQTVANVVNLDDLESMFLGRSSHGIGASFSTFVDCSPWWDRSWSETQVPFGMTTRKSKGKQKQIPCEQAKGQRQEQKQIPCGNDNQRGNDNNNGEGTGTGRFVAGTTTNRRRPEQAMTKAARQAVILSNTMTLAERLYPEAAYQLNATRRVLANVPDGQNEFAAHPRSMPLTRLAGHTAELAGFAHFFLTRDEIDMGTPEDPRKILRMTTKDGLLAEFDPLAARALETLKATSDAAFDETFTLKRQGNVIVARTRYEAYRSMFLDHMIHHRAQLGVYLRLLGEPVPATFGPSADEK